MEHRRMNMMNLLFGYRHAARAARDARVTRRPASPAKTFLFDSRKEKKEQGARIHRRGLCASVVAAISDALCAGCVQAVCKRGQRAPAQQPGRIFRGGVSGLRRVVHACA